MLMEFPDSLLQQNCKKKSKNNHRQFLLLEPVNAFVNAKRVRNATQNADLCKRCILRCDKTATKYFDAHSGKSQQHYRAACRKCKNACRIIHETDRVDSKQTGTCCLPRRLVAELHFEALSGRFPKKHHFWYYSHYDLYFSVYGCSFSQREFEPVRSQNKRVIVL